MITSNWRGRVYKKKPGDTIPGNWNIIREFIIKRDRFRCQRCDKKFPKSKLSVHHIVPRSKGGTNEALNLITLCWACHDFVEINELDTLSDIIGSYENAKIIREKIKPAKHEETFERPAWHAWVYGGNKNPKL